MKTILNNKLFLATFAADMLSNLGDVLYYLALMNYVLLLPEAKFAISLVTLSESLPFLSMLFMGIWGDRTKNKVDRVLTTLLFRVGLYVLVGLAMGFDPSLWVLILAVSVNILSDLAGQYENALFTPISLRIIPLEDREKTYAFRQATGSILRIVFQSSGAVLVGIMTYQNLAFFNAATFLASAAIMFLLRTKLKNVLKEQPLTASQRDEVEVGNFLQNSWQSIKLAYQTVQQLPLIKASILAVSGLNAVFAGQDALLLLTMDENPAFALVNPTTTLSMQATLVLVATILGSILSTTIFKDTDFMTIIRLMVWMPVFLFLGFFLQQIYLVLLVNFLSMVLVGACQPKLNAFIFRVLPEDQLATIGAGIDSFSTLGLVACRFLMSGLVVFLPAQLIALLFFFLSAILLFLTTGSKKTEVKQEAILPADLSC